MKVAPVHRQQDPMLVDLADLVGVCVQMVAGQRVRVDDQTFEDAGLVHHMLDHPDPRPTVVVDRRPVRHREVRDRRAELVG
jgi:hypothetical protein